MKEDPSLIDVVRNNPRYTPSNSVQWFVANINKLTKDSYLGPQKVLGTNQHYQTSYPQIGSLVFFMYDPKYKDTLPVYDTFPLTLIFSIRGDHFWGLNLHYLPYGARLGLLDNLMKIQKRNKDPNQRLKLSWALLNNASKFPEVQQCVKQYIRGHVKSMFVDVPMDAWAVAAMLPVQRFKKGSHQEVWKQYRRSVRK